MSGAISDQEAGKQRRNNVSPRGGILLCLIVTAVFLFVGGIINTFPLESLTAQESEVPGEAAISSEIKKGGNKASSDSESPSTEPSQTAPSETPPKQAPNEAETPKTVLPNIKVMEVSGPYCGIYALLACFDLFDVNPRLEEYHVLEYVGSFEGSNNMTSIGTYYNIWSLS